ncbi:MAG: hypothetical protein ACLSVD_04920 [Eggerthellaceae bacterium]
MRVLGLFGPRGCGFVRARPSDPAQVELWTYYNGTAAGFEDLVKDFNATKQDLGIVVTSSS